jgi:hypothetical protein
LLLHKITILRVTLHRRQLAKTISTNIIQVPFSYSESTNGEQWILSRDSAKHFIVQVSNGGKILDTTALLRAGMLSKTPPL